jgi:hypothetical protein
MEPTRGGSRVTLVLITGPPGQRQDHPRPAPGPPPWPASAWQGHHQGGAIRHPGHRRPGLVAAAGGGQLRGAAGAGARADRSRAGRQLLLRPRPRVAPGMPAPDRGVLLLPGRRGRTPLHPTGVRAAPRPRRSHARRASQGRAGRRGGPALPRRPGTGGRHQRPSRRPRRCEVGQTAVRVAHADAVSANGNPDKDVIKPDSQVGGAASIKEIGNPYRHSFTRVRLLPKAVWAGRQRPPGSGERRGGRGRPVNSARRGGCVPSWIAAQVVAWLTDGGLVRCRHSLSRLWVPHSSFHSASQAASPPAQEPPRPLLLLDLAEDRLDGLLAQRVARLAVVTGKLGLHRRPEAVAAGRRRLAVLAGLALAAVPGRWDQQLRRIRELGQVGDRPVVGVGQQPPGPLGMPAAPSVVVAANMGWSCCRSLACWVSSAPRW